MTTTTKLQSKKAEKEVRVIEMIRRQGVYTSTLEIDSVKEVEEILNSFDRNGEGVLAKEGPRCTEIEFRAKGGKKGMREYCLRLPNISPESLKEIGFKKEASVNLYIK